MREEAEPKLLPPNSQINVLARLYCRSECPNLFTYYQSRERVQNGRVSGKRGHSLNEIELSRTAYKTY